jgi:hypothetical protein
VEQKSQVDHSELRKQASFAETGWNGARKLSYQAGKLQKSMEIGLGVLNQIVRIFTMTPDRFPP